MSGNFVQRGKPAIVSKMARAQAAIQSGADLVLELPVTAALSSAEGFASEGVRILGSFCHRLCFGAESGTEETLIATAKALLDPRFPVLLKEKLETGCSFPAARQAALEEMGCDASLLSQPNDILAVEYCKAILAQNSRMMPMVIRRSGGYHDTLADAENPSATAVRQLMITSGAWLDYVPQAARDVFRDAPLHTLAAGERAMLARLRTMTDEEFEALPYGSEGLWRKLMHACHQENTLEDILTAVKSKRYTRSRLDRMVLCAFLGLTDRDLNTSAPYTRVLALNDRGREILKSARQTGVFPNIGQKQDAPYQAIETRCGRLYGLFAEQHPEPPDREKELRIHYQA
jgi:predicted nucleotidyltransferase